MQRQRPPSLVLIGCFSLAFAAAYGGWLLVYRGGDLFSLSAAALGNGDAQDNLLRNHLTSKRAIVLALLPLVLQAVLLVVLAWSGFGLLMLRGSARWSALFFSGCILPIALLDTVLRLWLLTLPRQPVKVTPFLMDAVVIQFAIVLGGSMFLPSVTAAYQADVPPESGTDEAPATP